MGLPPAYLFVVRHGNRLDAADKKWHLSSPTPYDPPLTYGGLLQARQVGHQIASILEQARADEQPRRTGQNKNQSNKRKRFRIVIHTSPFLRCIQTSIGLSSGLAQSNPDFTLDPFNLVVPPSVPGAREDETKSTVLRIDSYLGEWLSPEYFENITPPPSSSLMLGTAKADLLKREDYTKHTHFTKEPLLPQAPPDPRTNGALWSSSPTQSPSPASSRQSPGPDAGKAFNTSALSGALRGSIGSTKGYIQPRPTYAVSSAGKIPDGIVADARDECVVVDYQWDSMREPLAFGDGGKFGEEWSSMHKRFRGGVEKMVNWYRENPHPTDLVSQPLNPDESVEDVDEEVETVVVIVSHGAGCNALIGAITHQPVLMDVGIASITMASRKPGVEPRATPAVGEPSQPAERIDELYDIRLSASSEHLRSTNSTPVSTRRASDNTGPIASSLAPSGTRGRTSTLSSVGNGPIMNTFTFNNDPLSALGSRSSSANATVTIGSLRRESAPGPTTKPLGRGSALSSISYGAIAGNGSGNTGGAPPTTGTSPSSSSPGQGLWTPQPSSLRLMDDGEDEDADAFGDDMLPNFDQSKFASASVSPPTAPISLLSKPPPLPAAPPSSLGRLGRGPVLAAPIKLNTTFEVDEKTIPPTPVTLEQLGGGAGGLWGIPPPPDEAERFRDVSQLKRRWTVNDRS
ncbi:phosphoglycerate mutase family protein [Sarocladium implicatum]|nr:phosphoglycerate mutase family protein [Sarocladium implicatum]